MRKRLRALIAVCVSAATVLPVVAADAVLQRGYDPGLSGAALGERTLNAINVTPSTFGRLFSLPVDGRIYAQPLYVPNVAVAGKGTHNVLLVATMNDMLYAFDADTPGAPLWSVNFAARIPGAAPVPIVDIVGTNSLNIAGNVGIESTPVVDAATGTVYLVARTRETDRRVFRLHAIDLASGAEKAGGPVVLGGSYASGGTTLTFDPAIQNQRASLTLARGQVIIAFGSHEDWYRYYGWVMAYDGATLRQTGIFAPITTAQQGGGVWHSGRPPAVDAGGYVYLFVGNAWGSNAYDGANNFSESALKLDPSQGLRVVDWFTPGNWAQLDGWDADLTSSGPMLIPGTTLMIGGGKTGDFYLLDTGNMGHYNATDAQVVQKQHVSAGELRGGPVYWARSAAAGGPILYNWGSWDTLKAYSFTGARLGAAPVAQGAVQAPYPGGYLTLSANGDQPHSGIIWSLIDAQGDADHRVPPGTLVACDAEDVTHELWRSTGNPGRDDFGLLAKFVPPVVTGGKVYVATSSNQVVVYGLLPAAGDFTVTAWPAAQTALGGNADFVVAAITPGGTATAASWSVSGLPAGAAATFASDAQGRTVMHVTLGGASPRGTSRLQITATSGSATHTQAVLLQVPDATTAALSGIAADSEEPGASNQASRAIDGNPATFWHTQWMSAAPGFPHEAMLDLGSTRMVTGLSYLPRQDGCSNGTMFQYEVHLSVDGINWLTESAGGSFDYGPGAQTMACNGASFPVRQNIVIPPTSARFVQLKGLDEVNGNPWASAAELQVFVAGSANPIQGNFVLTARHSGLSMGPQANSTRSGALMIQAAYGGSASQQWTLAASSTAGYSSLIDRGSRLALSVPGASLTAGRQLAQQSWQGTTSQQYALLPAGDGTGYFTVKGLRSGQCADVSGASTAAGAAVIQWPCNGGRNQQWWVSPADTTAP